MALAQNSIIVSLIFLFAYIIFIIILNKNNGFFKITSYLFSFVAIIFVVLYNYTYLGNLNDSNISKLDGVLNILVILFYIPFIFGTFPTLIKMTKDQGPKSLIIFGYLILIWLSFYLWRILFFGLFSGFV